MFITAWRSSGAMGEHAYFHEDFLKHHNINDLHPDQLATLEQLAERLPVLNPKRDDAPPHLRGRPFPRDKLPGPENAPECKTGNIISRVYDSIEARGERCRANIVVAAGLEMKLYNVMSKIAVQGIWKGQISEEMFQKALLSLAEHEQKLSCWDDFAESVTSALESIPALWWYANRLIFQFYGLEGITDKTYTFENVLKHDKIKDRMELFRKHLKLGEQDSPQKPIAELRNINNHREDVFSMFRNNFGTAFDADQCDRVFAEIKKKIKVLENGYVHFAGGYHVLLNQLRKDAY